MDDAILATACSISSLPDMAPSKPTGPAYEYLDAYTGLCFQASLPVIPSIRKFFDKIDKANPDTFLLNGNGLELQHFPPGIIEDDYLRILLQPIARGSAFLKHLNLSYNHITDVGAGALADFLKDDKCLLILNVASNSIGPEGAAALARALRYNDTLQELDLSHNALEKQGGMALAEMLQVNMTINKLRVASCKLETDSLIALATVLANSSQMHSLDLTNNMVQSGGAAVQSTMEGIVVHLAKMITVNISLRELSLARMCITDHVYNTFLGPALKRNRHLTSLDLSGNRLTRDAGVQIAEWLRKNTILRSLNLSACAVQDEGAVALATMLTRNQFLQALFLDHNKVGSRGLVALAQQLAQNRALKRLHLWGNLWDAPACKAFAELQGGPIHAFQMGEGEERRVSKAVPTSPLQTDFGFALICGELQVTHLSA